MSSDGGSRDAVIAGYVRSPIGRYGGVLASVRPDTLAAHAIRALLERTHVDPAEVDDVILGCANQAGEDNRNVARMALLLAGLPVEVPGQTVNRLCGSGPAGGQRRRAGDLERSGRRLCRRRGGEHDPRARW